MNGRLYDPLVGRFLSADVVIQDPTSTQNYNRYSYCLNNPLKFNDPSGYRMAPADEYWNLGAENAQWFTGSHQPFGHSANTGGGGGASSGGWGGIGGVTPNWANGNVHYDSTAGAYTNDAGDIVGWNTVSNSISPYTNEVSTLIYNGPKSNPYLRLVGWNYTDGSSFYYSDGGNLGGATGQRGVQIGDVINGETITGFSGGMPLRDLRLGEGDPITGIAPTPSLSKLNLQKMMQLGKTLRQAVLKKQAPTSILRVDTRIKTDPFGRSLHNQKPHVHFEDGRALNLDGTWKHGSGEIPKSVNDWFLDVINFLYY